MIEYRIDRRSGTPAFLQIVQQTEQALLLGRLKVGDQLPTAREVVENTGVNPNTVLKAYRELERAGLVEPRPGAGTFVSRSIGREVAAQESGLGASLGQWMRQANAGGLSRNEVEALFKVWLDQVYPGPERALWAP